MVKLDKAAQGYSDAQAQATATARRVAEGINKYRTRDIIEDEQAFLKLFDGEHTPEDDAVVAQLRSALQPRLNAAQGQDRKDAARVDALLTTMSWALRQQDGASTELQTALQQTGKTAEEALQTINTQYAQEPREVNRELSTLLRDDDGRVKSAPVGYAIDHMLVSTADLRFAGGTICGDNLLNSRHNLPVDPARPGHSTSSSVLVDADTAGAASIYRSLATDPDFTARVLPGLEEYIEKSDPERVLSFFKDNYGDHERTGEITGAPGKEGLSQDQLRQLATHMIWRSRPAVSGEGKKGMRNLKTDKKLEQLWSSFAEKGNRFFAVPNPVYNNNLNGFMASRDREISAKLVELCQANGLIE